MFIIVLYEGLLGGACYVNAFYRISQEVNSSFIILYSVYASLSVRGIFSEIRLLGKLIESVRVINRPYVYWKEKKITAMNISS